MNVRLKHQYEVRATAVRVTDLGEEACEVVRALTNDYEAESGLVSLYEIWRKTRS
jgi:hypothetical protein